MQGQIAIGALANMERAVRSRAEHMGPLQVSAQHRQRQRHYQPQQLPFPVIQRGRGALVPAQIGQPYQHKQRDQRPEMSRHGELTNQGAQQGQPHFQRQSQGQPQPAPGHRPHPRQQQKRNAHAAKRIQQEVRNGQHLSASKPFISPSYYNPFPGKRQFLRPEFTICLPGHAPGTPLTEKIPH